ncbi:MAG: iron-containing alcohol dehydrogenase [Leptolyngbya sp.]|nr:iron-containing alcohol dehydrogenase [Candidatus Melainabacteria bacterium]
MNPFVFHVPTKIAFAEGAGSSTCEIVKELAGNKALIITDKPLLEGGYLTSVLEGFEDMPHVIFSDVPSDSDVDCVNTIAELARTEECDCIVAIGGGSVMDTAKVVNICLTLGGEILEYQGLNNIAEQLLPLVAVPTTAGTGSEVSMVAMVKDHTEGKKLLFGSRYLAPSVAILDPLLTVSLPPKLTAATGLDALTHAIESYVAVISNSVFTDSLCTDSARMVFENLRTATKNGADIEARSQMLVASTMAGVAFTNSGVGVVHALAHSMGAKFGTHHGIANSIFLPHGILFNMDIAAERYARLARMVGVSKSTKDLTATKDLLDAIEQLCIDCGLPRRLRDAGVPELNNSDIEELVVLAVSDPAIMFNPKDCSEKDIQELYERAY